MRLGSTQHVGPLINSLKVLPSGWEIAASNRPHRRFNVIRGDIVIFHFAAPSQELWNAQPEMRLVSWNGTMPLLGRAVVEVRAGSERIPRFAAAP
jgi:hypothetical protein